MFTLPGYKLEEKIYRGSTTEIYRGQRRSDGLPVTLKTHRAEYPTPVEEARFRREYEIGRQVDSPGVVRHYGLEQHQHRLFLVREDFGARGLRAVIQPEGVELALFLDVALQLAAALGDIHQRRIIHKDIKAGNVLINPETKVVKVIDFGISTQLSRERQQFLNPNRLEGTLAYISPEQTGRMNRAIDYRSDFYSLGVTLYELLCGRLPFESGDAMELVHSHIARTAPSPEQVKADVPQVVSEIIVKLMAKNARDRYQSAQGLQADLENARRQLRDQGQVRSFVLGKQDVTERFQIPQKLYGRQTETTALLESFERVANGGREMLLVTGYAGIGKSVLVHELHKPITERRGYFISGKYDQLQRNVPYNAVARAFEKLVQQLLTEDEAQLERWKENLLRALGPNGQVIIDVIPKIELIVGQQPAVPELGPTETQNRLNLVFQNFMRVFCRPEHPLVVFLDDLQWVDAASLHLIELMLTDADTRHLLLIGAYRDNEVNDSHPLATTLEVLKEGGVPLGKITLAPLSLDYVTHLVAETLYDLPDRVRQLAELVHRKADGNPFFTNQFLTRLYEDGLLTFVYPDKSNGKQTGWRWELSAIQAQSITDNVVQLMLQKLQRLPSQTQACLQLAACIGNQFDLAVLSVIFERDMAETLQALWLAVEEELLVPLDKNYQLLQAGAEARFMFLHDRIQQAAYGLIDDAEKQAIHLQVGRLLLASLPEAQQDERVFDIVNHLNRGAELITRLAERVELSRLNLQAGVRAKESTAYEAAAQFLQQGLGLLPPDAWTAHYELALSLYSEGCEVAYLVGQHEYGEQRFEAVLAHAQTALDKVGVYEARMISLESSQQYKEALRIGRDGLQALGFAMPAKGTQALILKEILMTKVLLRNYKIQDLIQLPALTDPRHLAIARMLNACVSSSFIAEPDYFAIVTLKLLRLSIQHGNSMYAAFAYTAYGAMCVGALGDRAGGYQFGQLALEMVEQFDAQSLKARVYLGLGGLINHWQRPLKEGLNYLLDAHRSGVETGDLVYASYGLDYYIYHLLSIGSPLATVKAAWAQYNDEIKRLAHLSAVEVFKLCHQALRCFSGETEDPSLLRGELFDETVFIPKWQKAGDFGMLGYYTGLKVMLCYLSGEFEEAIAVAQAGRASFPSMMGMIAVVRICFYDALALLAHCPMVDRRTRRQYLKQARGTHKKLKQWAQDAPENFAHMALLVEAERSRVQCKGLEETHALYGQAIALARQHGFLQDEALANELVGKFWLDRGEETIARLYMTKASQLYSRWGAIAKVRDLEQKYPQLLARPTMPTGITLAQTITTAATPGTDTDTTSLLDLSSVVKASQAISSEIELESLLANLLGIVQENAGAQRGCLVLEKEGQLLIEAHGEVSGQAQVLQSLSIEGEPLLLAPEIIRYVARTHEDVVLDDASQQGAFTSSSYVMERQIKSVLCVPLISRGALLGLIYLENNLAASAFTPERVELMRLLGTQASISITNAQAMRLHLLNAQLEAENARMEAELGITRRLQLMLLPGAQELTQVQGLDIAGFMEPAEEVGGDYYDVLQHNGRVKIGIGDVTGHGLESGVVMLMIQTAVRTLLINDERDPVRFLNVLNQMLHNNTQRMRVDKSMSLTLLDYQSGQGKLNASGQHEQMLVVRQGGQVEVLDTLDMGFPLGLQPEIACFVEQMSVELQPGDGVVLYSDGITEAENAGKEFYGMERLCYIVSAHWAQSAEAIKDAVVADVRGFIGEQTVYDDLTLLVLKQK